MLFVLVQLPLDVRVRVNMTGAALSSRPNKSVNKRLPEVLGQVYKQKQHPNPHSAQNHNLLTRDLKGQSPNPQLCTLKPVNAFGPLP